MLVKIKKVNERSLMEKMNYSIVEVFAEGKYTGNPLAVFKNAGNISDSEMQQIAK